jgi:hypothetical protein
MEEARAEVQELPKYRKGPSLAESYDRISPWKDPKVTERYIEAYRKLGL